MVSGWRKFYFLSLKKLSSGVRRVFHDGVRPFSFVGVRRVFHDGVRSLSLVEGKRAFSNGVRSLCACGVTVVIY